jgi:LAO/AO transport system kinase
LAFIRPSPAGGQLGGVARRTREAMALCEAAGFDVVIVETVGVGQSETLVADMTDVFALVLAPHGGDDLQGVKRGVMEAADLILVNKADRDPAAAARTKGDYASALRLMRHRPQDPEGFPCVRTLSALEGTGLAEAWEAVARLFDWRREAGHLERVRGEQRLRWFEEELVAQALARLHADPRLMAALPGLRAEVEAGRLAASEAARRALGA